MSEIPRPRKKASENRRPYELTVAQPAQVGQNSCPFP